LKLKYNISRHYTANATTHGSKGLRSCERGAPINWYDNDLETIYLSTSYMEILNSTLFVELWDTGYRPNLPFVTFAFSLKGIKFGDPIYPKKIRAKGMDSGEQIVATLSLTFRNLPHFAQLEGGVWTEVGLISVRRPSIITGELAGVAEMAEKVRSSFSEEERSTSRRASVDYWESPEKTSEISPVDEFANLPDKQQSKSSELTSIDHAKKSTKRNNLITGEEAGIVDIAERIRNSFSEERPPKSAERAKPDDNWESVGKSSAKSDEGS